MSGRTRIYPHKGRRGSIPSKRNSKTVWQECFPLPSPFLCFQSYLALFYHLMGTRWLPQLWTLCPCSSQERGKKGQLALSVPLIRNWRLFQKLPSRLPLYFIGKMLILRLITDKVHWDNMIGLNQGNFFFDSKVKY